MNLYILILEGGNKLYHSSKQLAATKALNKIDLSNNMNKINTEVT